VIIKKFIWWSIIYRYGVLREITIDNAKQFDNDMFRNPMGQYKEPTLSYLKQSRKSSIVRRRANGPKLYRRQYGVTTQHALGQQISHHSD
jgi:hypothetical protein